MKIANTDMAKAWDGEEGLRWAEHAARYEATSRRFGDALLRAAAIAADAHVLDIGCGTGKTTRDAARLASAGLAVGVDLSGPMLAYARERSAAEGIENVRFEQADAQVHDFDAEAFDAAISSFGSMFFADPVAAFANIARALRPGARLTLLAWRELPRNEWVGALRDVLAAGRSLPEPPPNAPGPFAFADRAYCQQVLTSAGYTDIAFDSLDEPMEFGADADDAFAFVRTLGIVRGLTQDLDDATKERVLRDVHTALAERATPEGVLFAASAWLVTARRP